MGGRTPNWLGQAGLTGGPGSAAIQVQVIKFYLGLGESRHLPIYLLAGLPIKRSTDTTDVKADLLNEYGGSLNLTVGTGILKFKGLYDGKPELGLRAEARAGAKLMDLSDAAAPGESDFALLALGTAAVRLTLPVLTKASAGTYERAGSLELGLSATFQWSNADNYLTLFGEDNVLPQGLFYFNASASLIITEVVYLNVQYTFMTKNSTTDLGHRTSISFNVLRGITGSN